MKLLKKIIHPNLKDDYLEGKIYKRITARGVLIRDDKVLLMYTKRYNDYTFPGGGIDSEEHLYEGLKRELLEETGAMNVKIIKELGYIEDYRPYPREDFDVTHELSYFYLCESKEFTEPQFEDYEIKNGMKCLWLSLDEAIRHNKEVIERQHDNIGLSVIRETEAMELIKELI